MESEKNNNDHDLLIELRTMVRTLSEDVKRLSEGLSSRVTTLEHTKLDKIEAEKESFRLIALCESKSREIFLTKTEEDKDFENRIRTLEKNVTRIMTWGAAGLIVLGVVEFLVGKFL